MDNRIYGSAFFALLLVTSTITLVAPPTMATAQTIANSTSPYVLQVSEFTNSTGTFWKDSRYWTFHVGNSTYTEKPFPYVGSEQPLAPLTGILQQNHSYTMIHHHQFNHSYQIQHQPLHHQFKLQHHM